MAEVRKTNFRAGESATEGGGPRTASPGHCTADCWLHAQVGAAYDLLKDDPSRAVSVDQVRAGLAAKCVKTR